MSQNLHGRRVLKPLDFSAASPPDALDGMRFAAGSMGPKIIAARDFVRAGGGFAGIGRQIKPERAAPKAIGSTQPPDPT